MYTFVFVLLISFIGEVIKQKYSTWASNLFIALIWIALSFLLANGNNIALKEGKIDATVYDMRYGFTYVIALIGCCYLLPVMLGFGKKNKIKKESDL